MENSTVKNEWKGEKKYPRMPWVWAQDGVRAASEDVWEGFGSFAFGNAACSDCSHEMGADIIERNLTSRFL